MFGILLLIIHLGSSDVNAPLTPVEREVIALTYVSFEREPKIYDVPPADHAEVITMLHSVVQLPRGSDVIIRFTSLSVDDTTGLSPDPVPSINEILEDWGSLGNGFANGFTKDGNP